MDESIISRLQQVQQAERSEEREEVEAGRVIETDIKNMNANDRMIFFCDKFGVDGYLDFMEAKIASSYREYVKDTAAELNLHLQPMITRKEREMLLNISECKSIHDINDLLARFYADQTMNPLCRYIRLALATVAELWSSHLLLKPDHNESWFRTHIYSAVFDNAFIYDNKFTSKRADCYSNITKEFDDVNNQRVDFILRNINDDNDYLSTEEKPSLKGVKSDLKKGKALQKAMLRKWTGRLGSVKIMQELEAITCQWQGLKLIVFGTRFITKDHLVTYRKGTFSVPKDETHAASFAHLLAAVLSLRRLVYLNYTKLNVILEAKYTYEIETMYFESDSETNFRSDSTAGLEYEERTDSNIIDDELETQILHTLCDVKPETDVVTLKNWEELILEKTSKKRKASSSI